MIRASSSVCCVDQLAEGEHHPRAAGDRHVAPRLERRAWPPARRRRRRPRSASSDLGLLLRRSRGPRPARCGSSAPAVSWPPIRCWMVLELRRCSRGRRSLGRGAQVAAAASRLCCSYVARAARVLSSVGDLGDRHVPPGLGARRGRRAGRSRRGRRSCARRRAPSRSAVSSSSIVARGSTSAPRLAALAARSTGQHVAVERARLRVAVAVAGAEALRAERLRQRADRREAVVLDQHDDELDALLRRR